MPEFELLGKLKGHSRSQSEKSRERQQRGLVVVLRDEKRLLISRQLHLRANRIDRGREPLIVLIRGQLFENPRGLYPRLCRLDFGGGRFGLQIQTSGFPNDEVARVLVV